MRRDARPPRARASRARATATAFAAAATVAAALLAAAPAEAQYFGQNRVRYDRFDVRILRTEHFELHYDAPAEAAARDAARMAERWYARLTPMFGGHEFARRKPIILYSNHPDFQQTTVSPDAPSEGTRGFAEAIRDRIVMPFAGLSAETDHVLGHEIVHLLQFDVAERSPAGTRAAFQLPLWFVEGQAEYLALGRVDPNTAMWLRAALLRGDLPTVAQLGDPRFFPYRYGHAFWAYVAGRWGDAAVGELYRAALEAGVEGAMRRVLQTTGAEFSAAWHGAIRDAYAADLQSRSPAEAYGRAALAIGGARAMQLAPALSPDGSRVALLAQRGLFGLDLVLADARTGRVLRTLAGPSRDPHGDAIAFLYASGAWSPDGRRFAHVVTRRGDSEIDITDVDRGRVWRRLRIGGVQSISAVAWSPDGRRLAIAGTRHGQPDLWLHDLDERSTVRLTDDPHAELQPAWSPDGRFIAIATDEGSAAERDLLATRRLRVALLDPVAGRTRPLPGAEAFARTFAGARTSNPQWAPDGRALYFVGDPEGVADLFRLDMSTGRVDALTHLTTGVSGITERSPALTVAAESGEVMFTAFDGANHRVYALDPERAGRVAAGAAPVAAGRGVPSLGTLPPVQAVRTSAVTAYLADPAGGLPGPTAGVAFADRYRARLTLEGIGQPQVGLATGPLGAAVGGGASATWGDLLGQRRLGVAVQAQGRLQDVGGQLFFLNQATRWNWFASLGRTPVLSAGGRTVPGTVTSGGQTFRAELVEQAVTRTFLDAASLGAQYPFSRTLRAEVSATGTRITQSTDVEQLAVVGGRVVDVRRARGLRGDGLSYGQLSAALVRDDAVFGLTSPIRGTRFRLEMGQALGDLRFGTATLDARRYLFLRPFTLAVRGLHVGRYGPDADRPGLAPLFVGDGTLVRGYRPDTFGAGACTTDPSRPGVCPELDRLVGSRIAAANVELRIPLSGLQGLALVGRGLPIELAPFVDAGMAWTAQERPRLAFDRAALDRVPVVSTGLAARLNLGPVIVEGFYAQPLHRPGGGVFGINLAPGW